MSLRLELREFRFPLSREFGNAGATFATREGLEVALYDGAESVGIGEASPLPGYSDESLDECRAALASFSADSLAALVGAIDRGERAAAEELTRSLPGAARFGIEGAAFEAVARRRGVELELLLGAVREAAPVPAMLVDALDPRDARTITEAAVAGGRRAIKLKVGRDAERELRFATELRDGLPEQVELRFDANRSLSVGRDDAFVRALATLAPCLIEEPYALEDLEHAFTLGLPLALDESLRSLPRDWVRARIEAGGVRALILKPTVLGLLGALAWAEFSLAAGGRALASHCFEGPTAQRHLRAFALTLPEPAPGLDHEAFRGSVSCAVMAD